MMNACDHSGPLDRAIERASGVSALARLIGVNQSTVSMWRARGGSVPVEHCAAIEAATGVTRRELRPDDWSRIWPELADAPATGPGALDEQAAA